MEQRNGIDRFRVVQVAVAPNEPIADLWRQILDDEGIVAVVKPAGAGFAFGSNALNQQIILVREDQAELARDILSEIEADDASG
jgi:hypothetical protein